MLVNSFFISCKYGHFQPIEIEKWVVSRYGSIITTTTMWGESIRTSRTLFTSFIHLSGF